MRAVEPPAGGVLTSGGVSRSVLLRACDGFLYFEGFEAGGADPFAAGGWACLDADFLQVRVSAAARRPQGVAARVAEVGPLAARITDFSHDTSPVLGYRSNLGTPENAIRKPSPDVGRRLYQIAEVSLERRMSRSWAGVPEA